MFRIHCKKGNVPIFEKAKMKEMGSLFSSSLYLLIVFCNDGYSGTSI